MDLSRCGMPMTTLAVGRRVGDNAEGRESGASAIRCVLLDMNLNQAAQLGRDSPVFAVGDLAESFRSLALKAHAECHEIGFGLLHCAPFCFIRWYLTSSPYT